MKQGQIRVRSEHKRKRDDRIVLAVLEGQPMKRITYVFQLSDERIRQIFNRWVQEEEPK